MKREEKMMYDDASFSLDLLYSCEDVFCMLLFFFNIFGCQDNAYCSCWNNLNETSSIQSNQTI